MNLFEVQDRLQQLPRDPQNWPRVMQLLQSYANGANPAIPPYVALAELQKRTQEMQKRQTEQQAQGAEAAQGTVKDQVEQAAGVMALQQGRQQQAMQQMAQGAGQQMGQVPPQVAQQGPVQAARGGLLAHLMRYPAMQKARRFNSGGIIAFAAGDSVEDRIREMAAQQETEANYGYGTSNEESEFDPREEFRRRLIEAERMRRQEPSMSDFDPEVRRKAFAEKYPELAAAAQKDVGAEVMRRLEEMQQMRRAEIERQREEAQRLRPNTLQMLAQAAMGTRGRTGTDALAAILGGYGTLSSKEQAARVEQERGFRGKELELQQLRMDAQNKYDQAQQAKAEGRMGDYAKGMAEFQRAQDAFRKEATAGIGREITALGNVVGREITGEARVEAAEIAATRAAARGQGGPYVRSTKTDQNGDVIAIMSDGTTKPLGIKAGDYNARLAKIISDMEKLDPKFAKLPEDEKRKRASIRLGGEASAAPAAAPAAPAAAPSKVLKFDSQGRLIQ